MVVNLSKDITVEDNRLVAKGNSRQTPAGVRLPLESAEAMRTQVIADNQVGCGLFLSLQLIIGGNSARIALLPVAVELR